MDLNGHVALGDRVIGELLLAGDKDFVFGNGKRYAIITSAAGWRSALDAYLSTGLVGALAVVAGTRQDELSATEGVLFRCAASVWHRAWGDTARGAELTRQAWAAAARESAQVRAVCHRAIVLQASHDGDHALADEHYRAAAALSAGDGTLLALLMTLHRSRHALTHDRRTEALAAADAAVGMCRTTGRPGFEAYALSLRADAAARLGRLDDALLDAGHADRLRDTLGVRHDRAFGLYVLGSVHRRRGEAEQARDALETAAETVPVGPNGRALTTVIRAELALVHATHDLSLAKWHAQHAVEAVVDAAARDVASHDPPPAAVARLVVTGRSRTIGVHCLGGFRVSRAGVDIGPSEWQSKKARDLLKILVATRGRPVPRPRLMELLWPGQPSATGGSRLSVQLSTLRRVLDPDHRSQTVGPIVADRAAVSVNLSLVSVDVERFLTAAADACAAHRRGADDAPALLAGAEELYLGDFMPDDPYADWAQELRDEAEAAYLGVLRAQAAGSSDVDHRVSCLLRILRRDAYDEEAHIELVHLLRQAGRHGEARRRYRAYARSMQEIGVAPAVSHETMKVAY